MPQQQKNRKIRIIKILFHRFKKKIPSRSQMHLSISNFYTETKWIFLAFFLFGAFHTVIESFLNTILVNPILSKFEDNMMARYGIVGLSLLIAVANTKKAIKNKKHISSKHLTCIILPTFIYIYYRFFGNIWDFKTIGNNPVTYLDILIGCVILPSIIILIRSFYLYIKQYIQDNTKETLLYSDNPITELEDDILGRKTLAKSIAQLLKNKIENTNQSFSLAITSKWGNGKTSFINLILKQLNLINKNKYEPFEFQAWKISSSEDITSIFFKELAKKIKPYHSNLTDDIVNYGQTLTNNSNSSAISLIHNICSLSSNKTIEDKFNSINKQLEKINKKIIIIIDDLDRLDGNEIFSLLKIIRNSAYFNNLLFISAFDEDYVIKALLKIKLPKPEQYIEKIFPSKYTLITPDKQTITNLLRTKILSIIEKEKNITQDIIDINNYDFNTINEISNIRDVYLLLNIFTFSYRTLQGGVSIIDLLYLSIFKYKYEIAYFNFIDNFDNFTYKNGDYFILNNTESKDEQINYIEYVRENYKEDSNDIIALINKLFSNKKHIYSFCKAQYTKCYLDKQHSNILQKDFNQLYSLQLKDIYKQLNTYSKLQLTSFEDLLTNWKIRTNNDCDKYMESIFYIGSTKNYYIINVQQIEGLIENGLLSGDKIKELVERTEYYYSTYKYEFLKETHKVIEEKFSIDQIIKIIQNDIEKHIKTFYEGHFKYLLDINEYFNYFVTIHRERNPEDYKNIENNIFYEFLNWDIIANHIIENIEKLAGELIHLYLIEPSNPHMPIPHRYALHKIINNLWPQDDYDKCIQDLEERNNNSEINKEFIVFLKAINDQEKNNNKFTLINPRTSDRVVCYQHVPLNTIRIPERNRHDDYVFYDESYRERAEQLAKELAKTNNNI